MPSDLIAASAPTPEQPPAGFDAALDAMAEAVRRLARQRATGELAALRRLDPDRPNAGAFFRLLSLAVPEPLAGMDLLPRWALVAWAMAQRSEDLVAGSLGQALGSDRSALSELRVNRLLVARGPAFRAQVRRVVRMLAASGMRLPYRQLGRLVLMEGRNEPAAEELRLRIARDYWRARPRGATGNANQGNDA